MMKTWALYDGQFELLVDEAGNPMDFDSEPRLEVVGSYIKYRGNYQYIDGLKARPIEGDLTGVKSVFAFDGTVLIYTSEKVLRLDGAKTSEWKHSKDYLEKGWIRGEDVAIHAEEDGDGPDWGTIKGLILRDSKIIELEFPQKLREFSIHNPYKERSILRRDDLTCCLVYYNTSQDHRSGQYALCTIDKKGNVSLIDTSSSGRGLAVDSQHAYVLTNDEVLFRSLD
jgi:hypothetical protein